VRRKPDGGATEGGLDVVANEKSLIETTKKMRDADSGRIPMAIGTKGRRSRMFNAKYVIV